MDQFCRTVELFGPPFCISVLRIWRTQILVHSLDTNAFYFIQQYFSQLFKFPQIKEGGPNFVGEPILRNNWIWSPRLHFKFKNLKNPNLVIYYILMHSTGFGSTFLSFIKFPQIKKGELISWGETILQNGWIIWSPFCISISKTWRTQILYHSLDINSFYNIQQYFSQFLKISSN